MTDSTAMNVHPWARPGPLRTAILVMGSAGAAAIHFAMMPAHADASTLLAVAFGLVAWLQAAFAVAVLVRPTRTLLLAGAILNVVAVGAWAWSRLFGLPFGIAGGEIETVGAVDALCAVLEIGVVTAAAWPTRVTGNAQRRSTWAVVAGGLATLLVVGATSAVLAAPSTHDHADGHANAETAAVSHPEHAAGTHDHAHGAATPSQAATPAVEPAGTEHQHSECTAPVTNAQRAAADALVTKTRATLTRYVDFNTATADGFVPISPPGQVVVHYGRPAAVLDGRVLDPSAPEALVYAFPKQTGPVLLGAPVPGRRRQATDARWVSHEMARPQQPVPRPGPGNGRLRRERRVVSARVGEQADPGDDARLALRHVAPARSRSSAPSTPRSCAPPSSPTCAHVDRPNR